MQGQDSSKSPSRRTKMPTDKPQKSPQAMARSQSQIQATPVQNKPFQRTQSGSSVPIKAGTSPAEPAVSQYHPIAIRPRPVAIALAPSPKVHGNISSIALNRSVSTVSNRGSEELTLTTSKKWVLPPRPKVKKAGKKVPKEPPMTMHKGKVRINSQIHSNINLFTNNEDELRTQLQNVSRENDNLKKVLGKLNHEIETIRMQEGGDSFSVAAHVRSTTPSTARSSPITTTASIATAASAAAAAAAAATSLAFTTESDSLAMAPPAGSIDPGSLDFHEEQKALKVINPGLNNPQTFLSPKDILLHPPKEQRKKRRGRKAKVDKVAREKELLAAAREEQEQALNEVDAKQLEEVVGEFTTITKATDVLTKRVASGKRTPQHLVSSLTTSLAAQPMEPGKSLRSEDPANAAQEWFSRNSFMDFDMYNEDMTTGSSPGSGQEALASPKYDFGLDDHDDFIMY